MKANHYIAELFKRHYDELLLLAIGYTKDKDAAVDVVMSVFEKLLNADNDLASDSESLSISYLKLVVKHRCLDYLKVDSNRKTIMGFLVWSRNHAERNTAFSQFEREAIERMMKTLADREYEIFKLHLDGFSNEEIAQSLSVSYNTVRNTLTTARKKIKTVWSTFMN